MDDIYRKLPTYLFLSVILYVVVCFSLSILYCTVGLSLPHIPCKLNSNNKNSWYISHGVMCWWEVYGSKKSVFESVFGVSRVQHFITLHTQVCRNPLNFFKWHHTQTYFLLSTHLVLTISWNDSKSTGWFTFLQYSFHFWKRKTKKKAVDLWTVQSTLDSSPKQQIRPDLIFHQHPPILLYTHHFACFLFKLLLSERGTIKKQHGS